MNLFAARQEVCFSVVLLPLIRAVISGSHIGHSADDQEVFSDSLPSGLYGNSRHLHACPQLHHDGGEDRRVA